MDEIRICSVSGGKDSTALYCLMVEYYGHDFVPIFADTGNEHPVTINYVRNLQRNFIGFELNPEYIGISERRLKKELGLFI